MDGIICINKPKGWTSFDVVAKMRGITKTRKIGHSGTLDPIATGVLPLFLGSATKACDLMPNHDKGYTATFLLGRTTDTYDITGTVLSERESCVTSSQLSDALQDFTGMLSQLPPMYSAVQINGKRLYEIARSGRTVERPLRQVMIYQNQLLSFDEETQTGQINVLCGKGTYIRSLISDIGEKLGTGAVLTGLVRHISGEFTLDDCFTLEQVQEMAESGKITSCLLPVEQVFRQLPEICLSSVQSRMFQNGVRLDLNRVSFLSRAGNHRVFDSDRNFLGLASLDMENMELKIEKILKRH